MVRSIVRHIASRALFAVVVAACAICPPPAVAVAGDLAPARLSGLQTHRELLGDTGFEGFDQIAALAQEALDEAGALASVIGAGQVAAAALSAQDEPRIVIEVSDVMLLELASDGTLAGSAENVVSFENKGDVDVYLSGLRIEPASGVTIVAQPSQVGACEIMVSSDGSVPISLSDCVSADYVEPVDPECWVVPQGEVLRLSEVGSAPGGIVMAPGDLSAVIGTIEWRFSPL